MKLKVLASGSKGNSYILENDKEALVIEAGVSFKELTRNVNHRKIVGCIISHEHKDHAAYQGQYQMRGIETYMPYTLDAKNVSAINFGNFRVCPFENYHNVPCHGYVITHPQMGKMIFATDTGYIEYIFKDVNHWLIECNNSKELLDKAVEEERIIPSLANRIVKDHMSLETCKDYLSKNDLSKTRNIVLIHLSDSNSNSEEFKHEVHELTGKDTYIAEKGLEIDLDLCPL